MALLFLLCAGAQTAAGHVEGQFKIGNLKATLGNIRQDMAEQHTFNRDLMTAMTELKHSVDALTLCSSSHVYLATCLLLCLAVCLASFPALYCKLLCALQSG